MVGIVVTISPSFSLYKIVVFPAASNPTEKKSLNLTKFRLNKVLHNKTFHTVKDT
mgnify:CR=1 FL=1